MTNRKINCYRHHWFKSTSCFTLNRTMWCVKRTTICAILINLLFQVCYCAEDAGDVVCCKDYRLDPALATPKVGERSLKKCKEYEKYAYEEVTQKNDSVRTYSCPFNMTKLVIGDFDAELKEFPHMVLIGFGNDEEKDWLCGGTLISENFVLTAAHCLTSEIHGLPTTARLGDIKSNSSINDEHVQQIKIKEYISHPQFSLPSSYNDIALLKLESPAKLNPYVRPACLYTKNQIESEPVLYTSWTYPVSLFISILKKKPWKVITAKRCNAAFSPSRRLNNGIIDETQICAGPQYATKDDCWGYIGGPLTVYKDTKCMFDVIGTSSFSAICGSMPPSVFTRVYPYLNWIEDIVWS